MTWRKIGASALRAIRTRRKVLPTTFAPEPDGAGTQHRAGFLIHARWTAVAAGAGSCADLAMLAAGGWMALAVLGMGLSCIPCAVKMWQAPSVRAAQMLVGMSLGMALLHAALLLGAMPMPAHPHGGATTMTAVHSDAIIDSANAAGTADAVPMLVSMGGDFAASTVAASWIRRRSSVSGATA